MSEKRSRERRFRPNIGIHSQNPSRVRTGVLETSLETVRLAIPARGNRAGIDQSNPVITGGKPRHQLLGAVGRATVDDQNLDDFARLSRQSRQAGREAVTLVQHWDNDRHPLFWQRHIARSDPLAASSPRQPRDDSSAGQDLEECQENEQPHGSHPAFPARVNAPT
jgi:hypothetical protein